MSESLAGYVAPHEDAATATDRGGTPLRAALAVITIAALLRVAIAAVLPPPPDETYYWEWSRRLAAGYFDHPPAIALLVRAGTELLGVSKLGIRLGPIVAGWGASLAAVWLAYRLAGPRAALRAAFIVSCMPLAAAGLLLATPDAPLLFAIAATLLALDVAIASNPGSARSLAWWLVAGVATGASLASKYNAVLVPLAVLAALLLSRSLRRHLATPAPYLAALAALLVFTPVLAWNAHHDWVSFRFQLEHGLGPARGSPLGRESSLLGGQLALVSPILFALLAAAVVRALRRGTPRERVLAVTAAGVFLFFCITVLRQSAEANWQAPAYVPAIVLLAAADGGRAWRGWLRAGCLLGAIVSALIYVQAIVPVLPIATGNDPTARGAGWDALAMRVAATAATLHASPGARTWLGGERYQDASEIAFHLPSHPATVSLNLIDRQNQYDFWPGFAGRARVGDNLVLSLEIEHTGRPDSVATLLGPYFARTSFAGTADLRRGSALRTQRHIWVFEGWRGAWPARPATP